MNNSEQGDKILSNFSHINSMNLRDAQISPEDISMIKNIMQNKSNIHLYISEAYGVNSNFIKKTLQIFEKKVGKVDLIIVDHLQIMTDNTTNYNRVSELSNISMDCKNGHLWITWMNSDNQFYYSFHIKAEDLIGD